jgi:deoxyribonuclease-4
MLLPLSFVVDSQTGELGCRLDRHECIGRGKLGLECFRFIMNHPPFAGLPLILETPPCDRDEVGLLYGLSKRPSV